MGAWDKIAGIGTIIAGGALSFVPGVGPLVGPAVMSAGGQILAGGQQKEGAQAAADIQQKGAAEAQDINKGVYEQTRGDLAPYLGLGEGATGNLRGLVGLPPVVSNVQNVAAAAGLTPGPGAPIQPVAGVQPPGAVRRPDMADPDIHAQARTQSESAYQRPQGTLASLGGGLVTVVSPDGRSTRQVSREEADYLESFGAKRMA